FLLLRLAPRSTLFPYTTLFRSGRYRGKDVTIQDVFEAVGSHAAGSMTDNEVHALESVACPGAGACGGHFTANTMATALDFLGVRSEEHTSELQSPYDLVCRLLL